MMWFFLFMLIFILSILNVTIVNDSNCVFFRDLKKGNIYREKNGEQKRVKITNIYYNDETKRDIIEYIYIDDDNDNDINSYLSSKSLYNFIKLFK